MHHVLLLGILASGCARGDCLMASGAELVDGTSTVAVADSGVPAMSDHFNLFLDARWDSEDPGGILPSWTWTVGAAGFAFKFPTSPKGSFLGCTLRLEVLRVADGPMPLTSTCFGGLLDLNFNGADGSQLTAHVDPGSSTIIAELDEDDAGNVEIQLDISAHRVPALEAAVALEIEAIALRGRGAFDELECPPEPDSGGVDYDDF